MCVVGSGERGGMGRQRERERERPEERMTLDKVGETEAASSAKTFQGRMGGGARGGRGRRTVGHRLTRRLGGLQGV